MVVVVVNVLSKKRNDMKDKIFEVVKNHTENEETAMQLTNELCVLLGVSGISLEQLKLQKEVYRERKESNGKATAYGEAHTDEIREGVIDHLIALCNYR